MDQSGLEVVSRSTFETEYVDPGGSTVLRVSPDPLNVRVDGEWTEIDPTLAAAGDEWTAEAHPLRPEFAEDADAADAVVLRPQGLPVAVSLVGADDGSRETPFWWWDDWDALAYRDVLPDADLEYTVTTSSVKESLVLQSAPSAGKHSWTWRINPGVLTPKLTDEDVLEFVTGGGKVAMWSPAPVAWDSAPVDDGAFREEVVLDATLTKGAGDIWYYRVTADEAWLQDSGRQYPVYIDPEMVASANNQNAYKSDGAQYIGQMHVGNTLPSGGNAYWRSVVNFSTTDPVGKVLEGANLGIDYVTGDTTARNGFVRVGTQWNYNGYGAVLDGYTLGATSTQTDGTAFPTYLATRFAGGSSSNSFWVGGSEGAGVYSHKRITTDLWLKYHPHVVPTVVTGAGGSPANGATKVSLTPTLKSTATAVTGSSLRYQFGIGSTQNGAAFYMSPESTSSTLTVPEGILDSDTTYYWRAYVRDYGYEGRFDQATWRSTGAWTFSTQEVPLPGDADSLEAVPGNPNPDDPEVIKTLTPRLFAASLPLLDTDSTVSMSYQFTLSASPLATGDVVARSSFLSPDSSGAVSWTPPEGSLVSSAP